MNEIEILTIEVGSTITKVNGFQRLSQGGFRHVAQGFAATSVSRPGSAVAEPDSPEGAGLSDVPIAAMLPYTMPSIIESNSL